MINEIINEIQLSDFEHNEGMQFIAETDLELAKKLIIISSKSTIYVPDICSFKKAILRYLTKNSGNLNKLKLIKLANELNMSQQKLFNLYKSIIN